MINDHHVLNKNCLELGDLGVVYWKYACEHKYFFLFNR